MYPETPIIKLSQMSKSLLRIYPMYIDNKSDTPLHHVFPWGKFNRTETEKGRGGGRGGERRGGGKEYTELEKPPLPPPSTIPVNGALRPPEL